jgi:hypothetical protein
MLNRLRDVFASWSAHEVKYIVTGSTAAILHGVPRATLDLDVLIEATLHNAQSLLNALRAAGFGTADLVTAEELLAHEITIFKDRYRIDVRTTTPGIAFADAWERRLEMKVEGQRFWVASRDDLIRSKRAAGRPIDLEDVRLLEAGEAGLA